MSADATREVRAGEELNLAALEPWLHSTLGIVGPVRVTQFPSGHSNLTYLLESQEQQLVLRRPPIGSQVKSAHDMGREHSVLAGLAPVFPLAPRPLAFCADADILGAPFYVMERQHGVILRKTAPADAPFAPSDAKRACEQLIGALVKLHAVDYQAAGLGDFGKPSGYVERQVRGWTERYHGSRTDDLPVVLEVAAWLAAHRPPDNSPALIHNDFKFDNVVFDRDITRIVAILDWEMATIGDPLMDLGTALAYWVEANDPPPMLMLRFCLTHLPGMMTRREIADFYAEASGRNVDNILFYYVFGLFKIAVVAQQIYYRFAKGLTRDPRFGMMIAGVRILSEHARAAIARGTL